MKMTVSSDGCMQNNISIGEAILLLLYYTKTDIDKNRTLLINKGFITESRDISMHPSGWRVTNNGLGILDSVLLDSSEYKRDEQALLNLAGKLKEIFPKGKKDGTSNYWSEGKALIVKRLKAFFKKYGEEYTDDQILTAAKKYVEGFNGSYQFMRTLKYFIYKDVVVNGEINYSSELLNYIENANNTEVLTDDWNTDLI